LTGTLSNFINDRDMGMAGMNHKSKLHTLLNVTLFVAVSLVPCFSFPQDVVSTDSLLTILYDDSGWILENSTDTVQRIFSKKVGSFTIPAIMVKQTSSVSPASLISAIEDVGNYCSFLHDSYLERADLLGKTSSTIDGYQLLNLPLVANRHHIFRLVKHVDSSEGGIRLDWTPLPRNSKYIAFIDSMDAQYEHPIYLDMNIGGWEITTLPQGNVELTYRLLADPAGRIPGFLIVRANRITAPQMVQDMIHEAARRDRR